MTQKRLLLAVGLCLLLSRLPSAAAEETDPWVAKVGEKTLYLSRLADTVAWRMRGRLREPGSGPTTILRQIVEERAVGQEAARLGLRVTAEDVQKKWVTLDTQIRDMSGGAKNLPKVLREQDITEDEFRLQLYDQLLKERIAGHETHLGNTLPKDEQKRIAQTEVVITEILKNTDVHYGWQVASAMQEETAKLPPHVVATVRYYPQGIPAPGQPRQAGEPITVQEFGAELLRRLPAKDVREIIGQECKAALTASVALSTDEMAEVIEKEKGNWNLWREMATQDAYRNLSYDEYVKMRYKIELDEMREDRYFRGLFGLISAERAKITPEEIRKEWEENKEGIYGDAIQITDIEILFAPQNPLLGSRGGRTRKDALRLANDILRRNGAGVPFDQIVREVNQRRVNKRPDGTFHARRLTVRNTATGRLLFEHAKEMEDGQLSRPFETLSEVHVMRREKFVPAPRYEDVVDLIRQGMAQRRTHVWLEEQTSNPERVQIRWPLPK